MRKTLRQRVRRQDGQVKTEIKRGKKAVLKYLSVSKTEKDLEILHNEFKY